MNESLKNNRILFISPQPFFRWRGSPIRVAFDVQALSEIGYEVDLVVLPFGEEKRIKGVNIVRVCNPFRIKNVGIGPSFGKLLFMPVLFLKSLKLIHRYDYFAIHSVEDAGIVGLFLAKLYKKYFVFEKHSDPVSYRGTVLRNIVMTVYSRVERFVVRYADRVICTGPGLVSQAKGYTKDRSKIFEISDIPSSLVEASPDKVKEIRSKIIRKEGEILVCFTGSFAVYQGVHLFFDAIPLAVERNCNMRFVIIGGTKKEIETIRQKFILAGCEKNVDFLGFIHPDELPNYLSAMDILVSPRLSGVNTPLKLLDYMKAGVCIVATDTSANRLLLSDDIAVFVPPDPREMAKAFLRLAAQPEFRRELGLKARALVDKIYNFGEFKKKIKECYTFI